jgi:hypothetical protein
MNFAELVGTARIIQNPLSRGGLTGIDVSCDADISHPFERDSAGHKTLEESEVRSRESESRVLFFAIPHSNPFQFFLGAAIEE